MSDETLGHVSIELNLGGNTYLLGARHFHIIDIVTGEELSPVQLGKAVRSSFEDAVANVRDNVSLWGFEGLVLEAKGRAKRPEGA